MSSKSVGVFEKLIERLDKSAESNGAVEMCCIGWALVGGCSVSFSEIPDSEFDDRWTGPERI